MRNRKVLPLLLLAAVSVTATASDSRGGADGFIVPLPVQGILKTYCYDCHGEKKSKGEVRLDTLSALSGKARGELISKVQEQIHFAHMPPEDKKQPSVAERKMLADFLRNELVKSGAPSIEDKLRYPNYGNYIDHDKLFSGEITERPFTPARRWLVSPHIFMGRIIDVFAPTGEPRDKYLRWPANNIFFGITNPFLLPDHSGVRDFDLTALDGGHLLAMISNAEWISKKQLLPARIKKGEIKANEPENKADRFTPKATPLAFEEIILKDSPPSDEQITAAIQTQFSCVLQRPANDTEVAKYLDLTRSAITLGGNTEGLRQMLMAVLLESEFLYRLEFGAGTPDEFGRKRLSPREASYAISYALGDWGPDATLVKAAQEGRLNTKEDYQREVVRLLADQNYYRGQIDRSLDSKGMQSDVTTHPKIIRFFREFFGYQNAPKVFKDFNRSNGYYANPDRGSSGTGGILVREADLIVDWYVKQDRNVFENLLGTEVFFAAPLDLGTDANGKQRQTSTVADKVSALNKVYDLLKDTDWKNDLKKVSEENKEAMDLFKKHILWNGVNEKALKQVMTHVKNFRDKGLDPNPDWDYPFGIHKLMPWLHSYDINPPDWEYPKQQPFKLANRKGILTHPAWLIAHSGNDHTDPIRRGRWIQEKLLGGRVPDVPITVDAQVPEHPHKTFRERVESVTEQSACWNCHQHMNPLGYPFERYDDFGRYRTEEPLENPENLIAKAKGKYDADTYKTKTVNTAGHLRGTGDPKLDGPVNDAIDLIDRLTKSTRVRQTIIRHAFRFYMGRNEMLSDAQTLIDADKAYVASGGSFKAVIVSLLTSDSFMYRK